MISFLVPFRGEGHRADVWRFVSLRLFREHPDAEIVVCSDDGQDPFGKSQAVNRGAEAARGDVLFIWDADCWAPPEQVEAAAAVVRDDPNTWARPWRRKVKLGQAETARILALGGDWDGTWDRKAPREAMNAFWASPPLALHRSAFEEVGGMDERFRGWGGEDIAFARALWKTGHGFAKGIPGDCVHLWHPRGDRVGRDRWPGQEVSTVNDHLVHEYNRARTPEEMRELIARRA